MNIGLNGRFLCAPLTGVQRFGHELLTRLPMRTRTTLLLPANATPPDGFDGDVVRGTMRGNAWEQLELVGLARRSGCDVVLHPANTLPLRPHRSVVVAHDPLFPISNPEWFTTRYALWHRLVIARALRRASAVLTVSEWSRGLLANNAGIPIQRIAVVPQGLAPFDTPASSAEVERVRTVYDISGRYVLAMGGRDPRKNIRFLTPVLDELGKMPGEMPAVIVIGDAHSRVHPPDAGITDTRVIRLLGAMDTRDTHALLTGAAALLFPSSAESFGRPPLEALACGTPALVGAYEAAHEVLGDAGRILPWDARLWAMTLVNVLNDAGACDEALAQAQPLRKRYSWDRAADIVVDSCQRAAAPRTAVPA